MISEQINAECAKLRESGYSINVTEEPGGLIHVIFDAYPLPGGYNVATTKLLLKLPLSYPNGAPDMFWVDAGVGLANGAPLDKATPDPVNGMTWLRFSWHPAKWNPGYDNLFTYLEFINHRLIMKK
jgi:hypothetical protein